MNMEIIRGLALGAFSIWVAFTLFRSHFMKKLGKCISGIKNSPYCKIKQCEQKVNQPSMS